MTKYLLLLSFILLSAQPLAAANEPYSLTIPAPLNGVKGRNHYVEQLLQHIFHAQGLALNIKYSIKPSNKIRIAKLVEQKEIDLLWAVASRIKAKQLRPVEMAIYNGYIGWRVLLIGKDKSKDFAQVSTVEQLTKLIGVQKFDWLDYRILKFNDMDIVSDMAFSGMFKAVETGIVDYFPRSVLEVNRELKRFGSKNLTIESSLMLRYPSASYFYVSHDNDALATLVNEGFQLIKQNGVYQQHFDSYFGETIDQLNLSERKVLELKNPFFKEVTATNSAPAAKMKNAR